MKERDKIMGTLAILFMLELFFLFLMCFPIKKLKHNTNTFFIIHLKIFHVISVTQDIPRLLSTAGFPADITSLNQNLSLNF